MHDLQEKFFTLQGDHDFEKMMGIKTIDELKKTGHLIIPDSLFSQSSRIYNDSLKDPLLRERYAIFQSKNGHPAIEREGIGKELNLKTLDASSYETGLSDYFKYFFGKPALALFHTHPTITEYKLALSDVHGPKLFDTQLTLNQAADMLNFQFGVFSGADLEAIEKASRYFKSLLLTTPEGTSWIINPNPPTVQTPIGISNKDSKEYNEKIESLVEKIQRAALKEGNIKEVLQRERGRLVEPLQQFCAKKGLLLFNNRDPLSNTLTRVQTSYGNN